MPGSAYLARWAYSQQLFSPLAGFNLVCANRNMVDVQMIDIPQTPMLQRQFGPCWLALFFAVTGNAVWLRRGHAPR